MFRPITFLFLLALSFGRLDAQTYSITTLIAAINDNSGYADGPLASARVGINGMAADAAGNLYFTDQSSTVRRLSTAGVVSTVAGVAGSTGSTDGTGSAARFGSVTGIAVDPAGNIYVADSQYSTIRKISPAGVVSTLAGKAGELDIVDGTGSAARFFSPNALALDSAGNLYVGQASAVRKVTPGGVVTTLAGGYPLGSVDGTGAAARFGYITGIVVDVAGNVYVTDTGTPVIRKITPAGVVTTLVGQTGQRGHADGVGANARFSSPLGLTMETSGNLVVTDRDTFTLRRVTPEGAVTTIAGQVDQRGVVDGLGGAARLSLATKLAVDPSGTLYLADAYGAYLRKGTLSSAPQPPLLHTVPAVSADSYQTVGARATVTYTAAANGTQPIALQWTKNGAPISGATQGTLTLASVSAADEGLYAVTATNAVGSVTSQPATLRVFTPQLGDLTTRRTQPGGNFLWSIASGAGQLVTVGTGGSILSSTDGRTWTRRESGTSEWLVGVTYGAGKFVVVGDRGTVLISSNAVTWTRAANSNTTQRLNNVVYARNIFVAVGEAGTILTSPDAQTWTLRTSGVSGWLRGLAYNREAAGTGLFAATGQGGTLLASGDGITWGTYPVGTTSDIEALISLASFTNFAGIGQDGVVLNFYTSAWYPKSGGPPYYNPGWNLYNTRLPGRLRGIAQAANAIFATGENGVVLAGQSANGPWSVLPSGTTANLVGGVNHGNSLYVVGENETILQSEPLYNSRLINISTRANVGTNANVMISGFVITGDQPKQVLLRAAGPSLGTFGLTGLLARPVLTLFDGASRPIASNIGWGTALDPAAIAATTTRVGAFPFASGSTDSALLVTLLPGSYTAQVSGQDGTTGLSLVEAYDAELLASEGSRAINISTRGQVTADSGRLIAGFVINGAAARRVLIRAVGPSLAGFGLAGTLAPPQIELYDSRGNRIQLAGAWSKQPNADELRGAAVLAGAFALQEDSQDAAMISTLVPGSYTVQVSGLNNSTGLALVEVYDLP